jgi:hypothetical protein
MRHIRALLAALLLSLALTPTPAAAATCGSHTTTFNWKIGIEVNDVYTAFTGTFRLTGSGCWTGTTSWGTSVSWARTLGSVPNLVSGPGFYAFGGGTTDFWVNLDKTISSGPNNWCRINMFPRLKLSKTGGWSNTGTSYTVTQDNVFTNCWLQSLLVDVP